MSVLTGDNLLDHADLQCPEGCGQMYPGALHGLGVYWCQLCDWHITRIEFTRNAHGTREQRRARIANRELGRP